jgi:hypothetical protein
MGEDASQVWSVNGRTLISASTGQGIHSPALSVMAAHAGKGFSLRAQPETIAQSASCEAI